MWCWWGERKRKSRLVCKKWSKWTNEQTRKKNYFILKWMCALCIERARTHSHTHTIERNTRKATTTTTTKKIKKTVWTTNEKAQQSKAKTLLSCYIIKEFFLIFFVSILPSTFHPSLDLVYTHTLYFVLEIASERANQRLLLFVSRNKQIKQTQTSAIEYIVVTVVIVVVKTCK